MDRKFLNDLDMYMPANEEMSVSITQNWTEQALECYSINCDAKNVLCETDTILSSAKCQKLSIH